MKNLYRRRLSESVEDWLDKTDWTVMTDEEEWWHKKITRILFNKKGKWGVYQHALYALRFQNYVLKIVPQSVDKTFTACVTFDRPVIYIGEGFLIDDEKLYQLNVIIRHELAHQLLRHQIRMAAHIGELPHSRISMSMSLHQMINIIADFEISNKKYTSEDKKIVSDMYLNGELIGGMITDEHRKDWMKLPIEEMYDKLNEELDEIASELHDVKGDLSELDYSTRTRKMLTKDDYLTRKGVEAIQLYIDTETPSLIWLPVDEYIATSKQFSKLPKVLQDMITELFNEFKDLSEDKLEKLLDDVASSKAYSPAVIGKGHEYYTPAEKFWANQVIKSLLGNARPKPHTTIKKATHSKEYVKAYNTIISKCGGIADCSAEELAEIIGALSGAGADDTSSAPPAM